MNKVGEMHASNVGEFDMSVHRDCVDTATLQRMFDMQVHTGLPESYSPSAHIDSRALLATVMQSSICIPRIISRPTRCTSVSAHHNKQTTMTKQTMRCDKTRTSYAPVEILRSNKLEKLRRRRGMTRLRRDLLVYRYTWLTSPIT